MSDTGNNDAGGGNAPEAQQSDATASAPKPAPAQPAPQAAPAEPDSSGVKTPWHLWVIGIVAVLWNSFGCFDYVMTQTANMDYLRSMLTEEQIAYVLAGPVWSDAVWAIGVWGALLGSIALLLRSSWAVWLFGLSILGLLASTIYTFLLTNGLEMMGAGAFMMVIIWAVAVFLFFYARAMRARGVLK